MERAKVAHDAAIVELCRGHHVATEALRQESSSELERVRGEHEAEVAQLRVEHEAVLKALHSEHEAEAQTLRRTHVPRRMGGEGSTKLRWRRQS